MEKRKKSDGIVTVLSVLLIGIVFSGLLSWEMARSAYREWQASAIADAQRLSSELRYRVQREQEPLIAASVLYFGSAMVTVDELRAARQKLTELNTQQFSLAFAFIVPNSDAGYRVQYSIGIDNLLFSEQMGELDAKLIPSVELALNPRSDLVIGELLTKNATSLLPLTIAVPNGNQRGVLLYLVNFSALLHDVSTDLDTEKLQLTITHPSDTDATHSLAPSTSFNTKIEHRTNIDMGQFTWDLEWLFSSHYGEPLEYRNAYTLFLSGVVFSILAALYVQNLIQQKRNIQLQVEQKSAELEQTQSQMIQQGKMAALGGMVAGISHELNTPIGNGLMAASVLETQTQELNSAFDANSLTQSQLKDYLATACDSAKIIEQNMRRAANLVSSFKQVAVDQTSVRKRNFNIKVMLQELETTLQPQLKHSNHTLLIESPQHLPMKSYPGPLGQVLTNLVMNSLNHAFPPTRRGLMKITVTQRSTSTILITYTDNGIGIANEITDKIFDPFFTTQLGQGGSGLGLHIVWNLVTEVLGGEIKLVTENGTGTRFNITLPVVAP